MAVGRRGRRGSATTAPLPGKAPIIQAHAPTPGAAPLVQARAVGGMPSSSIIQAPTPRGYGGGRWFGAPDTPKDRHTKLSGGRAGETSATRFADSPYSVENDEYGGLKVGIRDKDGNLTQIRRITKGEYDSVIKRGAAGAHLNPADLAVWRHHTGWKSDEEKAAEVKAADWQKKREAAIADAAAKAKVAADASEQKHRQVMERDEAKNRARLDIELTKQVAAGNQKEEERKFRERLAQQRAEEAANRQASQQRFRQDEELVKRGTHRWGYTDQQQLEINDMWSKYDKDIADGKIKDEEAEAWKTEIQKKIDAMPMRAVEIPESERQPKEFTIGGQTFFDNRGRLERVPSQRDVAAENRSKYIQSLLTSQVDDGTGGKRNRTQQEIEDAITNYDKYIGWKGEDGSIIGTGTDQIGLPSVTVGGQPISSMMPSPAPVGATATPAPTSTPEPTPTPTPTPASTPTPSPVPTQTTAPAPVPSPAQSAEEEKDEFAAYRR